MHHADLEVGHALMHQKLPPRQVTTSLRVGELLGRSLSWWLRESETVQSNQVTNETTCPEVCSE